MSDQPMEAPEVPLKYKSYALNILSLVKSSQNQNGLRHNDYARYHHYCIRKVHRLRKTLKFLQQSGNKAGQSQTFTKRQVGAEAKLVANQDEVKGYENSGEKYLHLMIYRIEADWAYAMDMKKALSTQESKNEESKSGIKQESQLHQKNANANRNPFRLNVHARKRFSTMYKSCLSLQKVADSCLDGFSKYELQAYVESMQAAYLMESKKWSEALDLLLSSKVIYQKICTFKDSLEAVVYQEKMSQLATFIRLCCFELKMQTGQEKEDKMASEMAPKIQKAYKESKQEQIENIQEITFNGKNIPLKSERIRVIFKKIENQQTVMKQMKEGELIKNQLLFVNILDDAQLVIKKEKSEESKKSEQSGQLYNVLLQYTSKLKMKTMIDRNLLQAKLLSQKLDVNKIFEKTQVIMNIRPQNIIRFYEKAIKSQKQIINAEKESLDPVSILQNEFYEKYLVTQIQYFVALHYVQENQIKQALVVLQSCLYKIEDAIEFSQGKFELENELKNDLLQKVEYAMAKSQAKYLQQENKSEVEMKDEKSKKVQFDNLYASLYDNNQKLKNEKALRSQVTLGDNKAHLNFLEAQNLHIEPSDEVLDLSKIKISKQFKLASALPKLKSVPATPQFFDMAGGYIQYPSAEVEAKKYEIQGGMFSAFSGFFGGQK